jgi:hypothetical protein
MSPRAACRLSALGFPQVHDYVPGKVDWLARNLPVHGTGAGTPSIGRHLRHDVVTATPGDTVGKVHARVARSAHRFALVTSTEAILLGRLRGTTLASADPATAVVEVMEPGPSRCARTNPPPRCAPGWRTRTCAMRSSPTPTGVSSAPSTALTCRDHRSSSSGMSWLPALPCTDEASPAGHGGGVSAVRGDRTVRRGHGRGHLRLRAGVLVPQTRPERVPLGLPGRTPRRPRLLVGPIRASPRVWHRAWAA